MTSQLRHAVDSLLPGLRADLEALIRIPSVSADPLAAGDLRRSAELTARLFTEAGLPVVEVLEVDGGAPAVLGHLPAPAGRPTVLLYAHHDVQPAGEAGLWTTSPFEPTERDGRLYARGSADDKAGIAAHLAAIRAHGGRPPCGVTVLIEGEEEVGSPSLGAFLERYRDRLAADIIVLADSENLAAGRPAFTTTLRGMVNCVVEVQTSRSAAHSGTYGGAAPDALTALCRLLATLHDDEGNVTVEGLLTAEAPDIDYAEDRFRAEVGLLPGVRLIGSGGLAERLWTKASATVLAIDATSVDAASNTLSPTARAKVGLRLAPGDDPTRAAEALARHLRRHAPWGVHLTVINAEQSQPHSIDASGAVYDIARGAYADAYGEHVVDVGGGGSIPIVAEFAKAFPAATILVTSPGGDPECNAHGADENLHLADFAKACLAEALLLDRLHRGSNWID
jgi:acetylornithine deacetylase/succinyl-diaminopimelate desuccinylase-like protein